VSLIKTEDFREEKSELHHNKAAKSQTATQKGKQIEALWICKDKQAEEPPPLATHHLRHPFVYLSIEKNQHSFFWISNFLTSQNEKLSKQKPKYTHTNIDDRSRAVSDGFWGARKRGKSQSERQKAQTEMKFSVKTQIFCLR